MNNFNSDILNQEQAVKNFLHDYLNKPKDEQTIPNILAMTCKYYNADRSYIFELNENRKEVSNTYEWCSEGISAEINNLQNITIDGLEFWLEEMKKNGEFFISSVSEDYEPSSKTYQILKPQGIESLVGAPLIADGSVIGFLGVDNPRVNTVHLLLLSVISATCCSEIANNRLKNSNKILTERMKIIQSMSEIYTSVYYIDIAENSYKELSSLPVVHNQIGSSGVAQEKLNFFCHNMMTSEYTDELLEFVDLSTLDERMNDDRIISRQYLSTVPLPDEQQHNIPYWAQCSFIDGGHSADGRLSHVIFVTQTIHESKTKELEANKKLQETNQELTALLEAEKQHTAIIGSLSSVFFALYYINMEENSFQEIFSLDSMRHIYSEKEDAGICLKNIAQTSSNEEYRADMRIFMDIDTLDERLGDKPIISQEYVAFNGEWVRCSFIPVEKNKSGKNIRIICGLRHITAEKERQQSQNNLIQALSMTYENVYIVNMDTAEAVCCRMGQDIISRYGQEFAVGDYELNIQLYVENEVLEDDRYLFENICSISYIKTLLKDRQTYSFSYRVFRNNVVQYFECQIVKPDSKRNEFAIAFKNIDDEMKRRLTQTRKLEAQSEIIEGLGSVYYSILLVDIEKDSVIAYRAEEEDGRAIAKHFSRYNNCWSDGIRSYAQEHVSEESRSEFIEKLSLEYIRKNAADYSLTYEKLTSDGIMYLQARVAFVREKNGGFVVVIGTRNVDDIIKKERQQEMALQAAYEAAEAANKAKTDFLSNMSHDIRTPMNGIIGMTAIAATHIDDKERVQDSLQKIASAGKHMLSLINEVLDMSKIESGKVDLTEEEFNLSSLIDNLLSMINPQIKKHNHELSVNISDVVHENVIGDSLRIQKVFTNLMSNAVKYTPDGGKIKFSIIEKTSGQAKVGCYEFIFEDNGIGMSEEFIARIFEPFVRASDGRVNKIQGTGLGMPISRNIVRMMGGDIKVESKLNVGSRFTVTIYLKLQDTVEIMYDKFINLNVLVADDDEMSLESCCSILNDLGMNAEGVSTGAKAVEYAVAHHHKQQDYFACIIDWKMPDMDGIETTKAIRREIGNDVPIIIISAYDWSDIEQEARAVGANAFISKPLFRSRLAKTFNSLVNEEENCNEEAPLEMLGNMDFTGHRILLAEDNDLNAEIAEEIFETTGLLVERACNGKEAVDMMTECADGYYDIIFMDIRMPEMNGYDATRAIRAMNRSYCRKIPIIAMTANAFAEDVQAAKTVGMNEHIAKPLDLKILARTLNKWLK